MVTSCLLALGRLLWNYYGIILSRSGYGLLIFSSVRAADGFHLSPDLQETCMVISKIGTRYG